MLDLVLPKFHKKLWVNWNRFSAFELKQSINMLMWKFSYPINGNEQAIYCWFHKLKTTDRWLKPEKHLERGMSVCISSQLKDALKRTTKHHFLLYLQQSQMCEGDVGTRAIYISNGQVRGSVSIWPPLSQALHWV